MRRRRVRLRLDTVWIMTIVRSVVLFVLAALAEIGGAWLVWQGVREHRGLLWIAGGVLALGAYSARSVSPQGLRPPV
jgi:hypothetical protein